jgi:ABC-2 type transport system ATP-binding protein
VSEPQSDKSQVAVSVRGLTKVYRGRIDAVSDLTLQIGRGIAFGLLGPNGAGKSTLVKMLLSIVRPTAGTGALFGQDIGLPAARRGVGYLPERPSFPPYLTGREVCRYFGRLLGLGGPELEADIDKQLSRVGMTEAADRRTPRYSKGMVQRIGLAQAMLGQPRLIVLDEPTDGLDPVGRHEIREVIRELKRTGTTVLINSHLLEEVEHTCDELAILHGGKLLRQGTVDQICATVRTASRQKRVRFAAGPLLSAQADLEKRFGTLRVDADKFELRLLDEQVTEVIEILRRHKVVIHAIEPERESLEAAFIELVGNPDQKRGRQPERTTP